MIINLKFSDVGESIKFELNKNTVFFGLNGKGKTRTLKTISELTRLANSNNLFEISTIIKKLNLEELKIGNFDAKDLFEIEGKENLENSEKKKKNNFWSKKAFFIEELDYYLSELKLFEKYYYTNNNIRLLNEKFKFIKSEIKNQNLENINDFRFILNILSTEINMNQISYKLSGRKKDVELLEKIRDMIEYLMREYNNIFYNSKNFEAERKLLKSFKEEIIKNLKIRAKYISPEKEELDKILKIIKEDILHVNNHFFQEIWDEKIEYKAFLQSINNFKDKFFIVNKFLQKYEDLELKFNENEIKIFKRKEVIEHEKLSSGEKRILILFLNIVFSEEEMLLIDEPEISLSINYQSKIITDLVELGNKKILMMATHAPYIYQDAKLNEFNEVKI
ncbi:MULTISPECIES: AAA family ATPase [Fusobacterium]|uniref:AAA family ATPase n=1 Tax=Fusobacterium TaxID=848 RepID=UPI000446FBC1|nr:AAA family ATPase [Fusobacterium sp. OBRC1]EUB33070.1 AAA domain protein [Fusobacterium sp. OBRC1]